MFKKIIGILLDQCWVPLFRCIDHCSEWIRTDPSRVNLVGISSRDLKLGNAENKLEIHRDELIEVDYRWVVVNRRWGWWMFTRFHWKWFTIGLNWDRIHSWRGQIDIHLNDNDVQCESMKYLSAFFFSGRSFSPFNVTNYSIIVYDWVR